MKSPRVLADAYHRSIRMAAMSREPDASHDDCANTYISDDDWIIEIYFIIGGLYQPRLHAIEAPLLP